MAAGVKRDFVGMARHGWYFFHSMSAFNCGTYSFAGWVALDEYGVIFL